MIKIRIPKRQRFIFDGVSWDRYTRLLHEFSDRHLRFTYDRGILEIMTLSYEHETLGYFLGRLVIVLTEELNLPIRGGGSTTFRRKRKQKGLEPDDCYWIAHEAEVRNNTKIDLRTDPPPDLAIEVNISHSSLDRMGIYASLKLPEVWRHDAQGLSFFTLNAGYKYDAVLTSASFSMPLSPADLMPFIAMRGQMDDNAVIRQFRDWIRAKIQTTRNP
jgi:Uma2 family endonuclease